MDSYLICTDYSEKAVLIPNGPDQCRAVFKDRLLETRWRDKELLIRGVYCKERGAGVFKYELIDGKFGTVCPPKEEDVVSVEQVEKNDPYKMPRPGDAVVVKMIGYGEFWATGRISRVFDFGKLAFTYLGKEIRLGEGDFRPKEKYETWEEKEKRENGGEKEEEKEKGETPKEEEEVEENAEEKEEKQKLDEQLLGLFQEEEKVTLEIATNNTKVTIEGQVGKHKKQLLWAIRTLKCQTVSMQTEDGLFIRIEDLF